MPSQTSQNLYIVPVQARSQARFKQIIEAAKEVIARDWYGGLSIQTVAKQAKISTTSIYRYFPDRSGFVAYMMDEFVELQLSLIQQMNEQAHSSQDWRKTMRIYSDALNTFSIENKYTYPAQVALKADKKLTNHWFEKLTEIQTGLVALYKSMGAKGSDERINSVALTSLLILDAQMLNYVNLKNRNLYEQRSSFDSVLLNYLQDIFD